MDKFDVVLCDIHKKPCIIKTGVKEGPKYGRSYYICGQPENRCSFVKPANFDFMTCRVHPGHTVELQAVHFSRSTGEQRHFFRCTAGKKLNKNWCGYRVLAQNKNKENPTEVNVKKSNENASTQKSTANALKDVNKHQSTKASANLTTEKASSGISKLSLNKYRERNAVKCNPQKDAECVSAREAMKKDERNNATRNTDTNPESPESDSDSDDCVIVSVDYNQERKNKGTNSHSSGVRSETSRVQKACNPDGNEASKKELSGKCEGSAENHLTTSVREPESRSDVLVDADKVQKAGKSGGMKENVNIPLAQRLKLKSGNSNSSTSSSSSSSSSDTYSNSISNATHKRVESSSTSSSSSTCSSSTGDYNHGNRIIGRSQKSDSSSSDSSTSSSSSGSSAGIGNRNVNTGGATSNGKTESSSDTSRSSQSDCMSPGEVFMSGSNKPEASVQVIQATKPQAPSAAGSIRANTAELQTNSNGAVRVITVKSREDLKNKVDGLALSLRNDRHRKGVLEDRLQQQKHIMKTVNLSSLPDRGQKVHNNIEELNKALADLNINIESREKHLKKLNTLKDSLPKEVKPAVEPSLNEAKPPSKPLVQTRILDHALPLPAHVFQQMYAANPQAQTLYGGRMTAARLREVGTVTSDALERLYKQLESQPDPSMETEDPKGLNVPLMTHQRQALSWLIWRERQHPPGGILADDMGLGKTLTTISLILKQREAKQSDDKKDEWINRDKQLAKLNSSIVQSNATLIVCPASLLHQWNKEIERRCRPRLLKVLIYHGANRDDNVLHMAEQDVVLTTYNIISKEVGITESMKTSKTAKEMPATDKDAESALPVEDQPVLLRIGWLRIVLDEAHCIKNNKSLTAMSVCRLRAGCRWALTGTPIQNDLMDMYSLLRFLRCSPFDEFKVWKKQVDNKSPKGQQRLNTLVKTLLLRRTKDQKGAQGKALVPLPKKNIETHKLKLSEGEKTIYDKIFEQSRKFLQNYLKRQEDKLKEKENSTSTGGRNNPWSGTDTYQGFKPASQHPESTETLPREQDRSKNPGGGQILLLLLRLRQCCSHMSLMKNALDVEALQTDDGLELDIVEQMQQLALGETADLQEPQVKKSDMFEKAFVSTKIKAAMDIVKEMKKNSTSENPTKSVVVSQWTQMLEVIECHLKKIGLRCCVIKGNVPPAKRMELVDTFNNDPSGPEVMLVSLRAGGVGLNLIGGNHLFMLDMHWNPALEDQACDRVYRVGQKKDVFIHRFICEETVEEKIVELQNRKKTLASNVLSGAKATANKLTLADLKELFGLSNPPVGGAGSATFRPASAANIGTSYKRY